MMMENQGLQSNIEVVYRREEHSHPHVVLVVLHYLRGYGSLKYGDVQEKIHFLGNTRFKTLEDLSKTF